MAPKVKSFYDHDTGSFSYIVYDKFAGNGAVIDPVLNFDLYSGSVSYQLAEQLLHFIEESQLTITWILETHAHADHLTAAQYLKGITGAKLAVGGGISSVQKTFKGVFDLDDEFCVDGSQYDHCFADGEEFFCGELTFSVMATPGHTPDSVTYLVGDAAFVGDTLFHPSVGTARCDFPDGSAKVLYQSIQKILSLPSDTRLFLCHDYPEEGREATCQVTIENQLANNIHIGAGKSMEAFVAYRTQRDQHLAVPKLLYPAVQFNINAGTLHSSDVKPQAYFKLPLNFPKQ